MFLDHLKRLYPPKRKKLYVKVDRGKGRRPDIVLQNALKVAALGEYHCRYLMVNGDRCTAGLEKIAQEKGFDTIIIPTCFEVLALRMLSEKRASNDNWDQRAYKAKRKFRRQHLPQGAQSIRRIDCERLFPVEVIDARIRDLRELERLVAVFLLD